MTRILEVRRYSEQTSRVYLKNPTLRESQTLRIVLYATILALVMALSETHPLQAQDRSPDLTELSLEELLEIEITPINVLGMHTHLGDQWMLGYRYMLMRGEGNRSGSHRVSTSRVLEKFMMSPTQMKMEEHMFELMYAPTDTLSLMAMLPYKRLSMDMVTVDGVRFTEDSEGLGDLTVMGLYTFHGDARKEGNRFVLNAGLSFPTGSINKKDFLDDPSVGRQRLEYAMQLGSGTFDLMPGITYLGQTKDWAWGAQAIATIRTGRNHNGYRLGNQYRFTGWGAYRLTDWLAPSVRLDGRFWGNIHGADSRLDPTMSPTMDPKRQKGRRLDLLFGLNLYVPKGTLKGNRLTIEGGLPIHQWLKGPQLETDWQLTVGWTYTF